MCCCDTGGGGRQKIPIFIPEGDLSSKISPQTYHNPLLSYYRAYFTPASEWTEIKLFSNISYFRTSSKRWDEDICFVFIFLSLKSATFQIIIFSYVFQYVFSNCNKGKTLDICQTGSCNHLGFSFPPGGLAKQPDAAWPQDRLKGVAGHNIRTQWVTSTGPG